MKAHASSHIGRPRLDPRAAGAACRLRTRPLSRAHQAADLSGRAEKPATRDTNSRAQHLVRLTLYPWRVDLYKPPRAPMQRVPTPLELATPLEQERASLVFSYLYHTAQGATLYHLCLSDHAETPQSRTRGVIS